MDNYLLNYYSIFLSMPDITDAAMDTFAPYYSPKQQRWKNIGRKYFPLWPLRLLEASRFGMGPAVWKLCRAIVQGLRFDVRACHVIGGHGEAGDERFERMWGRMYRSRVEPITPPWGAGAMWQFWHSRSLLLARRNSKRDKTFCRNKINSTVKHWRVLRWLRDEERRNKRQGATRTKESNWTCWSRSEEKKRQTLNKNGI